MGGHEHRGKNTNVPLRADRLPIKVFGGAINTPNFIDMFMWLVTQVFFLLVRSYDYQVNSPESCLERYQHREVLPQIRERNKQSSAAAAR